MRKNKIALLCIVLVINYFGDETFFDATHSLSPVKSRRQRRQEDMWRGWKGFFNSTDEKVVPVRGSQLVKLNANRCKGKMEEEWERFKFPGNLQL